MKNLFIFFLLTSQLFPQKYEKDISYKEKRILEYKKEGTYPEEWKLFFKNKESDYIIFYDLDGTEILFKYRRDYLDREAEIKKLTNNLLNGINTIIISPRRWGKSSLVEKVTTDIQTKNKSTKIIVIDLFSFGTEEEFYESFAREVIKSSSSRWQDWIASGKEYFKKISPKISVGMDPHSDFNLSFDWKEIKKDFYNECPF
jgi:hypothetical protein